MVILFGKNREMILEVAGTAQNYAWGKLGSNSKVAVLGQKNGLVVNESTPYAELWMGTHPSGPSVVKDTSSNLSLKQVINKDLIGSKVWEKFDHDLPFLLKVTVCARVNRVAVQHISINTSQSGPFHPKSTFNPSTS